MKGIYVKVVDGVKVLLRTRGRTAFLSESPRESLILDIGCGNNSPFYVKRMLPNCIYTGIDISDYNQHAKQYADKYIVTSSEYFSRSISNYKNYFDILISSHNIEHCVDREGTILAMLNSIKVGGRLYFSFPTDVSVNFPSRRGTLKYQDDLTHLDNPPDFNGIIKVIEEAGFEIIFSKKRYRPKIYFMIGLLMEPFSFIFNKVLIGTWELYGFESIIWARKIRN